jgi:recombination protein RecA
MNFDYKTGFDEFQEVITYGIKLKIIKQAGSWFSYKDDKIGQGSEKVKKFLRENPKIYTTIRQECYDKVIADNSELLKEELKSNKEEDEKEV